MDSFLLHSFPGLVLAWDRSVPSIFQVHWMHCVFVYPSVLITDLRDTFCCTNLAFLNYVVTRGLLTSLFYLHYICTSSPEKIMKAIIFLLMNQTKVDKRNDLH